MVDGRALRVDGSLTCGGGALSDGWAPKYLCDDCVEALKHCRAQFAVLQFSDKKHTEL